MAFRLDQFEISEVLGAGGMAVVYAGTDLGTQAPVAIKVMTADEAREAAHRHAFVGEVRSAARLLHPGIVRVLDVGEVPDDFARETALFAAGAPYLVMERVDGQTLDRVGDLDWTALRRLVLDLLDALAHAHALGVIHRDLKPSNILVDSLSLRPRLTDFGIARIVDLERDADSIEAERRIAGTPNYMAPERVLGRSRDQGPWTDLYSVGILVWKIATGEHPFRGTTDEVLRAQVRSPLPTFVPRMELPDRLEEWLEGMLAKSPHARFRRAADAAAAFVEVSRSPLRDTFAAPARIYDAAMPLPTLTNVLERPPDDGGYLRVTGLLADWQRPAAPGSWRAPVDLPSRASPGSGLGLYGLRVPPLVGRNDERDELWRTLLDVVRTGRPHCLHLHGIAGVGKTRLAEWFARRAVELGVADVHRIVHSGSGRPADGLTGMLRRFFRTEGLGDEAIAERVRREIAELPRPGAPFPAYDAAVIARILCHREEDGARSAEHLSTRERFYAASRLLQALAGGRAQIVWIEDAHGGLEGLRFARFLAEEGPTSSPLLLLITTRTDGPFVSESGRDDLTALVDRGARTLVVAPLDDQDVHGLLLGSLGLAPELAAGVVRRAEGIPMYAVQAVDEMVERAALVRGEQGYTLAPSSGALPDDAHALWCLRLEHVVAPLGPDANAGFDALLVAAVLGRWVDLAEWAATLRMMGVETAGTDLLERLVEQLQRRGFAGRQRGGWLFAHATMRESLCRIAQEGGQWERLHRACARSLAALHGQTVSPALLLRVASHLADAGEREGALDEVLRGIEVAKDLRDYNWLERFLLAADAALAEFPLEPHDPRRGAVLVARARLLTQRNRLDEAQRACESLIEEAGAHEWTDVEGAATYQLGSTELSLGHTERAIALFQRATVLCERVGDARNFARAREGTGYAYLHQGRFEEARPEIEAAGAAYAEFGDVRGLAFNYYHRGIIARYEGDTAQARALYEECLRLSESLAFRDTLANAHNALGDLDRQDGDLDAARVRYRDAYELWSAVGAAGGNVASINLGLTLVQQGRWDDAAAILTPLAHRLERENAGMQLTFALAGLLPVHAARGATEVFDATLERFAELRRNFGLHDPDLDMLSDICVGKWHRDGDRQRVEATVRAFER